MIEKSLTINTENVLGLLIRNLYGADPNLTVRELLQNSHDAITEAEDAKLLRDEGVIDIRIQPFGSRYIEIEDNGIGMNGAELEERLGVVADGSKLQRARLNPEIIGKFGIGFLSTLIVADRVVVITRRADSDITFKFDLNRDGKYTVTETEQRRRPGTSVKLHVIDQGDRDLREKIHDLLEEDGIKKAIREWGYLLRIPIRLTIGQTNLGVVNARSMPWSNDGAAKEAFSDIYGASKEHAFIYRFSTNRENVRVNGVFYFESAVNLNPTARLYCGGLLVNPEMSDISPSYAPFAICVIDCPDLQLDLARRMPERNMAFDLLAAEVHAQFTEAFLKFSTEKPSETVAMWPNVDNSTIMRLIAADNGTINSIGKTEAENFLIRCGPHIPFYVLDELSGGLGRPVWRTIAELVARNYKRPGTDGIMTEMTVPFTSSKVPAEKDILVTHYKEIIDVGHEAKAHELLIGRLVQLNDAFAKAGFRLTSVNLPPVEGITSEERETIWKAAIQIIDQKIWFRGKAHQVAVERFNPSDTPIIIQANDFDQARIEQVRSRFQHAQDTQEAALNSAVVNALESIQKVGGTIRVVLNANNLFMETLAKAALQEVTAGEAQQGLMSVAWRAVIDFFGFGATRDMMGKERQNTQELIALLLARTVERQDISIQATNLRQERDALQQRLTSHENEVAAEVPSSGELRRSSAIVGIVDLVKSTALILGAPEETPESKAAVLRGVISIISSQIESFGKVIGFTGDGLQFILLDRDTTVSVSVLSRLESLENTVQREINEDSTLCDTYRKMAGQDVRLRIALDYGDIYQGRVGKRVEHLGLAFVKASRLCNDNELYSKLGVSLLLTAEAFEYGAAHHYWKATACVNASDSHKVIGLEKSLRIYRPHGRQDR